MRSRLRSRTRGTHVRTRAHAHMHAFTRTRPHVHTHMYTRTYTHTYTHTHTHTHTHTRTADFRGSAGMRADGAGVQPAQRPPDTREPLIRARVPASPRRATGRCCVVREQRPRAFPQLEMVSGGQDGREAGRREGLGGVCRVEGLRGAWDDEEGKGLEWRGISGGSAPGPRSAGLMACASCTRGVLTRSSPAPCHLLSSFPVSLCLCLLCVWACVRVCSRALCAAGRTWRGQENGADAALGNSSLQDPKYDAGISREEIAMGVAAGGGKADGESPGKSKRHLVPNYLS